MTSLSAKHLLDINENNMKMDEDRSKVFHNVSAKLLYVTKKHDLTLILQLRFYVQGYQRVTSLTGKFYFAYSDL